MGEWDGNVGLVRDKIDESNRSESSSRDDDIEIILEKEIDADGDTDSPSRADSHRDEDDHSDSEDRKDGPQKRRGKRFHPSSTARSQERYRARLVEKENNDLRAALADREDQLSRERQGSLNYYKNALDLQKQSARVALERAIDEGDAATQADMNDRISLLNTKIEDVRSGKYSDVAPSQQYDTRQVAHEQPDSYGEDSYSEAEEEWAEKNFQWFSPQSRDYDPEFAQIAQDKYKVLRRAAILNGRGAMVGTPEFFDVFDKYLKEEYILDDHESHQDTHRQRSNPPKRSNVSPVSSNNYSNGGPSHRGRDQISLSLDEQEHAASRNKSHPDGRPFSRAEKLADYAKLKLEMSREGNLLEGKI